jgi:hypothetical protein
MITYHGERHLFDVGDKLVMLATVQLKALALATHMKKRDMAVQVLVAAEGLTPMEAEELVAFIENKVEEARTTKKDDPLRGGTVASPDGEVHTASGDGAVAAPPHSVTIKGEV